MAVVRVTSFLCLGFALWASDLKTPSPDVFTQNRRLGRGVNIMGNDPIWRVPDQARFQVKHLRLIKDSGFDSVRINLHPFGIMGHGPDGALTDAWFEALDWAVTNATANGLMVILDLHEYGAMGKDPQGNHEKFLGSWRQLAEHYQTASDQVLFEILNEPSKELAPALWNQYLREALAIIRQTNPTRTVVTGPAFWNSIGHLDELELPAEDRNLIVTIHYYTPMEFTHQGAPWSTHKDVSGVEWAGTDEELELIRRDFSQAADWAQKHNRPIFLGEFGSYDKAPLAARVCYTEAVARAAETCGWSWTYWQFDSDFILYDIDADSWVRPIRDALMPPSDREMRAGAYQGRPFRGGAQFIPGDLECELYDEGGENLAYHETDGRNHGSGELNRGTTDLDDFRKGEDVDISFTKDDWDNSEFNLAPQELGRLYVGWTAPGEWVRYTVDIAESGSYTVSVKYTSRYGGSILLECDGRPAGDPIRLDSTANPKDERRNWHHWNDLADRGQVVLPAGRHVLTLKILVPGNLNLDQLRFQPLP